MLVLSRFADAASNAAPEAAAISAVDPIARRPLHAAAIDRLREAIVRGELAPGTRLNERVLATQLGISRTPLREAFKLLANEGLAELLPNRGAIVTPIHAERIEQTLRVMGALEALVGELVCQNASDSEIANIRALHFEMRAAHARGDLRAYFDHNQAIHLALVQATGNSVLLQTYRQLNDNVRRVRYMANLSASRWEVAVAEHEAILQALTARDGTRLKELLSSHLAQKTAAVLAVLTEPITAVTA